MARRKTFPRYRSRAPWPPAGIERGKVKVGETVQIVRASRTPAKPPSRCRDVRKQLEEGMAGLITTGLLLRGIQKEDIRARHWCW